MLSPLLAASPIVHINALLNATATLLLVAGLLLIKRGRVNAHKWAMLGAFAVSIAFFAILGTHIPLAFCVPFLAVWQIYLGYRATGCCAAGGDATAQVQTVAAYAAKHRRLARWTFPIWLYVSVTGVIVYVMLYHLWPTAT